MTTNVETTEEYAPELPVRLEWAEHAPEVFKAMVRLDAAARKGLDARLLELVKIRASQINHCAFCTSSASPGSARPFLAAAPAARSAARTPSSRRVVRAVTRAVPDGSGPGSSGRSHRTGSRR